MSSATDLWLQYWQVPEPVWDSDVCTMANRKWESEHSSCCSEGRVPHSRLLAASARTLSAKW